MIRLAAATRRALVANGEEANHGLRNAVTAVMSFSHQRAQDIDCVTDNLIRSHSAMPVLANRIAEGCSSCNLQT